MIYSVLIEHLKEFIENEARSCSMDYGCVTPQYVYRMWGGAVALEDVEAGLKEIKNGVDKEIKFNLNDDYGQVLKG